MSAAVRKRVVAGLALATEKKRREQKDKAGAVACKAVLSWLCGCGYMCVCVCVCTRKRKLGVGEKEGRMQWRKERVRVKGTLASSRHTHAEALSEGGNRKRRMGKRGVAGDAARSASCARTA